MNTKWNQLKEFLQPVLSFFNNRKLHKSLRISAGVFWNLTLITVITLVLVSAFAGGVGAGYFASLVKDEKVRSYESMKKDIYNYEETSELYFANNVFLGEMQADILREEISINDVSEHLKQALIATEDEYFEVHDGVVPKAVLRAVFQEFTNSAVQSGGSTLTQQLIKNQILTNEVSFERKAKEMILALRLERFFEKEEILEAYLNVATFGRNSSGNNVAGVQAAAQGIFGVDAKDLSIPQAAFIAGLPQAPFAYTPFTNQGVVKSDEGLADGMNRMKTVLTRMFEEGYLTEEEFNSAINYNIKDDFISSKEDPKDEYPYLTQELENRAKEIIMYMLAEKDGITKADLEASSELYSKYYTLADRDMRQSGYEIHSTINKEMYDAMQVVKNEFNDYGTTYTSQDTDEETGEVVESLEPVEVGAILIENKTGRILSFVGGRDFEIESSNHATQTIRPNGSTNKPLVTYAPAIEYGLIGPGSPVVDAKMSFNGGDYNPSNYTNKFKGIMPARKALAYSYNLPAVWLYNQTISRQPIGYLEQMGFSNLVQKDYSSLSLSLGALTYGVTVEENVNAYSTFANNGQFIDAYMIEKIVDKDNNIIYSHQIEPQEVFSPQTAYLTLDMMRDTIEYGTGVRLNSLLKFQSDLAGKSGTSQEFRDAWFVATNPNITFGTWMGYDNQKYNLDSKNYSTRNITLFSQLLNSAYDTDKELIDPEERFQMPGGIVSRSFCLISGDLPSDACSKAGLVTTDLFNAKFVPSKTDDSLLESRAVTINGKKYLALPNTPEEFSEPGVILNPDFVDKIFKGTVNSDPTTLFPEDNSFLKNVLVAENKIEEDGSIPGKVNVTGNNTTLTWTPSPSGDVIGYRVYSVKDGKRARVAIKKSDESFSVTAGNGEYIVVAVDVAGNESPASNVVRVGEPPKENPEKPDKPKDDKKDPPKEDKPNPKPEEPPAEPEEPEGPEE
ncbi:peptidoglycan glycosyltransferase [Bacillus coahuilensis m2-6]|uniref:transglycosylase domain-containing protein n=1 Tax=Bacillus coahuilensis TaxID=408580 RepID=UPI00075015D1|nr:transglycosylase domain-containing protein [Bacillus coahuilensis]KUP06696.1 peptidoglycan glycosyltransferase [Bacillus coahuilensis m2-6]